MKIFSIVLGTLLTVGSVYATTNETVTLGGAKVALSGTKISVGDNAPAVTLVSSDLKEVTIGGKKAQTQVILVVPSIDTPICDMEARTFNTKAAALKNTHIYVVSMDLPFAGKRYCAAHGIDNITVLSDFQTKAFAKAYGTLMNESILKGIEARAVFIIKDGKVSYKQLVPEIKQAPDYEAIYKAI